jgi:hypothetical protein
MIESGRYFSFKRGRLSLVFGLWSLVFGLWSLVFGLWSLVFGLWLFDPRQKTNDKRQ